MGDTCNTIGSGGEEYAGANHRNGRSFAAEAISRLERIEQLLVSQKEVFTVQDLATFLGLTPSSIYKMIKERRIPFTKPNGKTVFFLRSDVIEYLRSGRVESEAEMRDRVRRTPSHSKDFRPSTKGQKLKKSKLWHGRRRL